MSALDRDGRTIWVTDAHRDDGQRFVVRADQKLTAFLQLEGGDSVFAGGPTIDHRGPQCDPHGLIMKLEIRSNGGIAVSEIREIICCLNPSGYSNKHIGTSALFSLPLGTWHEF